MKPIYPSTPHFLILFLLALLPAAAQEAGQERPASPAFESYSEGFDAEAVPQGWKTEGNVRLSDHKPFSGKASLEMQRSEENFSVKTTVTSPAIPVAPGMAEIQAAFRANLQSPDNSFLGASELEFLNSQGEVVDKQRLVRLHGKTGWRRVSKMVEVPNGATQARLTARLEKAAGSFWIDSVSLSPLMIDPDTISRVKRIELKTETLGNLLYPEEKPVFQVTVKTDRPLPEANRKLSGVVTDYWGAEQGQPVETTLADGGKQDDIHVYTGTLDFSAVPVVPHTYYDVRVQLAEPHGLVSRETSSFALLPKAPNQQYPFNDIPFNIRSWDNRNPAHFRLSDRIGILQAGVWGWWKFEPPYEGSAPGINLARELGQGPVVRIPTISIEHRRNNWEKYTDEVLQKGYQAFYKKFHDEAYPMKITLGNEPRTAGPTIPTNVHAYQVSYEAIKAVNPETFVIGTSVGPVEEYFKLGFHKYSDAVDFHTYGDHRQLEGIFKKYAKFFEKYGHKQPIWSTEMGLNSQGLSRRVVAGELIKKTAFFFRLGGQNMCWATLCFPDREGKLRGGADDSHNVFSGLYGNYAPRLDAIAYYHVVNGVGIKPFRDHQLYEGGITADLFATDGGDSFIILWKEQGVQDVRLPLPGVEEVTVTSIDGVTTKLATKGNGLSLRVTPDPILLSFKGGDGKLAPKLEQPGIELSEVPAAIVRGKKLTLKLKRHAGSAGDITVTAPQGWKAEVLDSDDAGQELLQIKAPADTEARFGAIRLTQGGDQAGRYDLLLPVEGQINLRVAPAPGKAGEGAVDLFVRNQNDQEESVSWKLALKNEIAVDAGEYSLERPRSPGAYFAETAAGELRIPPGEEATVRVPLAGVDPLSAYELEAEVTEASGRSTRTVRYIGGFVGVPKAKGKITLDGKLDEPDWRRAEPRELSEERQFRHLRPKSSNWTGKEDLSAKLRFLWDDANLYVGVEVTDDVFANDAPGGKIWNGDGLQFLIDPMRASKDKPGKYDYALGVGADGPAAMSYLSADGRAPTGPAPDIRFGHARAEGSGGITYEVAIPWTRLLPFVPAVGANLGMALALNENDLPVRDAFMVWFGDLHTKEVETVGDLILTD